MPECSQPWSDLDARLAELDRGLRELQALLMPERGPLPSGGARSGDALAEVRLHAGPFESIEAVRRLGRSLAAMPGVSEVTLLGFEAAARAVFDMQLS